MRGDMRGDIVKGNLFERVTGRPIPTEVVGVVEGETALEREILTHLHLLLNTREGSVPHLPGYGLTDMGEVYARLPDSESMIREKLRALISDYEPRLSNVVVDHVDAKPHSSHLEIVVRYQLRDEPRRGVRTMRTVLSTNGNSYCLGG